MQQIIQPLRKELEKLKEEQQLFQKLKDKGKLSKDGEMALSCANDMLSRFDKVLLACEAEIDKIKQIKDIK